MDMVVEEDMRASMEEVVIEKDKLLARLKENREAHRALFDEAIDGYEKRVIQLLQEQIRRVKKGIREQIIVSIPCPEDHTRDYDRTIQMLEWGVLDTVTLTTREFDTYVRDNWSWTNQFTTTASMYNSR